jgi:outer membrane usher protein
MALAAFGAGVALCCAAPREAGAQARADAIINPTGRLLEMSVPLHYGKFYLGDLQVRLTPDQQVQVAGAALLEAVQPLLREEAFSALSDALAAGDAAHCDLADLREAGFDFRFDPGAVSIRFVPTLDQKVQGDISVHARRASRDSPNAAEPAAFSAFLNLRSAVDYIGDTPSGDEGLRAPRLDLEGAARWQGVVVEAEASFEPDEASVFGETGEGFKRRGTRLVRDFEEQAVRASAGDVYPVGTSFQYTPDLLGISLERSYSKLQPGKNIRPTSRRSFRIERTSNVDVEVNGIAVRRLKLDPGDYNLDDLPVGLGLNDVALLIEDDVGKRERLEFSVFLDHELLAPGYSEWAFAAGVPSRFAAGEPDYGSSDLFLSGFYRRGLSDQLTGEAHLQSSSDVMMSGLGVLLGTSLGLFALEGAASLEHDGSWGAALDGQYALANIPDAGGRMHSVRLSAKVRTPDFTAAIPDAIPLAGGDDAGLREWLELSASYGTELPFQISAFLSAGYGFGADASADSYHADLGLSRALGRNLNMGVSAGYYTRYESEDELSLLMRLQYRPDRDSSLSMLHDTSNQRSSVAYRQRSGHGVGSWQATVDLAHEALDESGGEAEDDFGLNGSLHYTGNRANLSLFQDSRIAGLDAETIDQRTSLRLETAIAFADGHVAVGRPISSGFAIIAPHDGLAGNEITIGKAATGYSARTDFLGSALLPSVSPYALNRVDYDVADLPPGYDLGDGLFDLMPGHKSGYALSVGSSYTVTALGTLLLADGEPAALITGHATETANPEKRVELFTNRTGRFTAQGLAPGHWTIEMASRPVARFSLDVPPDTVGLYRAGTLRPAD